MSRRELRRLADRERYARNLLAVFNRSTAQQQHEGASWYPAALRRCQDIATALQLPPDSVVYALAALSPLQPWDRNVTMTRDVARAVKHKRRAPSVTFRRQVNVASRCLRGAVNALSGPKVCAFAAAILGDTNATVIDGWMLRAAGWERPYSPKPGAMYNTLGEALTIAAQTVRLPVTTFQAIVWLTMRDS